MFFTTPAHGLYITLSFPTPFIIPGIPVLAIGLPSKISFPRLCPLIVSITTSTSSPAVNPGPSPIVIGAISLFVP